MLKIKVEHKIGDIVEHSFNEMKFKIVGYNLIGDRLQYVCVQLNKTEFVYFNPIEIKPSKETFIGFIKK